jgi:GNAT superfamily N-acetyltransferase
MTAVTLRRLLARDLPAGLLLSQAERWSHRLDDWEFHYRLGLSWAACDAAGELLGTASWWPYGDHFATVGLVLVDRRYQGKGIGRQLMNTVMDEAGPRVLQLVATNAGLTLYHRCGFRERDGIGQHHGVPSRIPDVPLLRDTVIRKAACSDLGALCDLDAAAFGASRKHVLAAILELGDGFIAHRDGRPVGFALTRQAGRGTAIGPVVADGQPLAIALIAQQLAHTTGFIRVDIPIDAVQLGQWLEAAGLSCVDRVTTMVRGEAPQRHTGSRIFGLVSQALG